jgi:hypothetical protein
MSPLPTSALKSHNKMFIWNLGNIEHTFQFPVEVVLHIISFILCCGMNVQNNNITPATNSALLAADMFLSVQKETCIEIMGPMSPQHGAFQACGWRDCLQLWRVVAKTLNKQSGTNNKGRSFSLGFRCGTNKPSP